MVEQKGSHGQHLIAAAMFYAAVEPLLAACEKQLYGFEKIIVSLPGGEDLQSVHRTFMAGLGKETTLCVSAPGCDEELIARVCHFPNGYEIAKGLNRALSEIVACGLMADNDYRSTIWVSRSRVSLRREGVVTHFDIGVTEESDR